MSAALKRYARIIRAYWFIYLPLWAVCLGLGYLTGHG